MLQKKSAAELLYSMKNKLLILLYPLNKTYYNYYKHNSDYKN